MSTPMNDGIAQLIAEDAALQDQARSLYQDMQPLQTQLYAVFARQDAVIEQLLAALQEQIWNENPGWSRNSPTTVHRVDRMAKRLARGLLGRWGSKS